MDKQRYINGILRKVKCPRKTKQRLREDLAQDIDTRLAAGETLADVIRDMGLAGAVAAEIQQEYPVRPRSSGELAVFAVGVASGVLCILYAGDALLQYLAVQALMRSIQQGGSSSVYMFGGEYVAYMPSALQPALFIGSVVLCAASLFAYRTLRKRQ